MKIYESLYKISQNFYYVTINRNEYNKSNNIKLKLIQQMSFLKSELVKLPLENISTCFDISNVDIALCWFLGNVNPKDRHIYNFSKLYEYNCIIL